MISQALQGASARAANSNPSFYQLTRFLAARTAELLSSVAHSMAIKPAAESVIKDALSEFWNDDKISI